MIKDSMQNIIKQKLKDIELKENVRILLAVESGSRAWGFESSNSDYDVRFIYIRRTEDYLRLNPMRDTIEWQLDEVLDINGWDIRKALQLLHNSNLTLFEWCDSPIVYKQLPMALELFEIMPDYFSFKKGLYHYCSTAQRTYAEHLCKPQVKLKKYFYALRPILAARWIINKQVSPPMTFYDLAAEELPSEFLPIIETLLTEKKNGKEDKIIPVIEQLNQFIEKEILRIKKIAEQAENTNLSWQPLNELFYKLLYK